MNARAYEMLRPLTPCRRVTVRWEVCTCCGWGGMERSYDTPMVMNPYPCVCNPYARPAGGWVRWTMVRSDFEA